MVLAGLSIILPEIFYFFKENRLHIFISHSQNRLIFHILLLIIDLNALEFKAQ